jgi:hypothetical protein
VPAGKIVPPGISIGSVKVTTVFLSPFWPCAFVTGAIMDAIKIIQKATATALNRFIMYLLFELHETGSVP